MNEIEQLKKEIAELKSLFYNNNFSDLYIYTKPVLFRRNIRIGDQGITIGEKITDKLSFHGITPRQQDSAITKPSGGATTDTEARTAINSLIDLVHNLGLTA